MSIAAKRDAQSAGEDEALAVWLFGWIKGPPGRVYCSRLIDPYSARAVGRAPNMSVSDRDRAGAFYNSFTTASPRTATTIEPLKPHSNRDRAEASETFSPVLLSATILAIV
jgi:hypothetical protein